MSDTENFVEAVQKDSSSLIRRIDSDFDLPRIVDLDKEEDRDDANLPAAAANADAIGPDTHCEAFTKVFVLWRPWEECARCLADMAAARIVIPTEGDYTCPHTQEVGYKEIKDVVLRGRYILQREDFFKLKSGALCAHLVWWVRDKNFAKLLEEEEKERLKNQVYPPDTSFQDPNEEKKEGGGAPTTD